ncbi:hypothetical protein [Streptomyces sp. PU-14G]|uniref:hypothetical protein n=1 Tax=Streptomyces sp. PU-14G TaxID=2800808 RepID=UPI0034DF871E
MDPPPTCPNCPERLLWKDTRETGPGKEDSWFWFCAGCRQAYVPTPDQKLRFTYAGGGHRDPGRVPRAGAGC